MDINVILIQNFEKWLTTLGYAPSTIYGSMRYVTDFFFYLKTAEITTIEQITPAILNDYHQHLQKRKNKRQNGSLSTNYITANINALKRFSRYLQQSGQSFFEVTIKTRPRKDTGKTILSPAQIQSLYKACTSDMLGIRDRAMLSVYYGCGLRRSEGISLDVKDVLLTQKRIYVRKGKNYRERYVPITTAVQQDLENYIHVSRKYLQSFKPQKDEALFLSLQARRMSGNALIERLHKLQQAAGIHKETCAEPGRSTGLHTLRHSIATHLLQSGMSLEEVSRFLGHSSLESTQIYTHLAHE